MHMISNLFEVSSSFSYKLCAHDVFLDCVCGWSFSNWNESAMIHDGYYFPSICSLSMFCLRFFQIIFSPSHLLFFSTMVAHGKFCCVDGRKNALLFPRRSVQALTNDEIGATRKKDSSRMYFDLHHLISDLRGSEVEIYSYILSSN